MQLLTVTSPTRVQANELPGASKRIVRCEPTSCEFWVNELPAFLVVSQQIASLSHCELSVSKNSSCERATYWFVYLRVNLERSKYSVLLYAIGFLIDYQHMFEKCDWVEKIDKHSQTKKIRKTKHWKLKDTHREKAP